MKSKHLKFFLILALPFIMLTAAKAQKHLAIGDPAPAFALTDQDGKTFDMKSEVGKHVLVIYFYPKDESMVCTKEACSFRDSFNDFTKAGAKVVGINNGTVESHKAFRDHYKLPFTLLSDPNNKVLDQFGVKGKFFMTGRETFIVGLNGKIAYQYSAMMEGKGHVDKALAYIKSSK